MTPGGNSKDPMKRANAHANLRRGGNPAPPGNLRALGVPDDLLERLLAEVEDDDRDLLGALSEVVPLRAADGRAPATDVIAVERAAVALRRWRLARRLERRRAAEVDSARKGPPRRAAEDRLMVAQRHAQGCEATMAEALAALGLDPASRARLGGELAMTAADLARARMAALPRAEVEAYLAGFDDGGPPDLLPNLDQPADLDDPGEDVPDAP